MTGYAKCPAREHLSAALPVYTVGMKVRVARKNLGRPGLSWVASMDATVGKVGEVIDVKLGGECISVKFPPDQFEPTKVGWDWWDYTPSALEPLPQYPAAAAV